MAVTVPKSPFRMPWEELGSVMRTRSPVSELLVLLTVDLALSRHGLRQMRAVDHFVAVRGLDGELVGLRVRGNDHGGAIVRNPFNAWASLPVLDDVSGRVLRQPTWGSSTPSRCGPEGPCYPAQPLPPPAGLHE